MATVTRNNEEMHVYDDGKIAFERPREVAPEDGSSSGLVPAFERRMRALFHRAESVNQRVAGLVFDRRARPVGLTFCAPTPVLPRTRPAVA